MLRTLTVVCTLLLSHMAVPQHSAAASLGVSQDYEQPEKGTSFFSPTIVPPFRFSLLLSAYLVRNDGCHTVEAPSAAVTCV